jgi:hypothetical protein
VAVAAQLKNIGAKIEAGQGTMGARSTTAPYDQLARPPSRRKRRRPVSKKHDVNTISLRGFFSHRGYDPRV